MKLISDNINDLYATTDLCLAATLCLYIPVDCIEKTPSSPKVTFLFKKTPELNKLLDAYWNRELCVVPQLYFAEIKTLKGRIYQQG